jgi:hypothetical protein
MWHKMILVKDKRTGNVLGEFLGLTSFETITKVKVKSLRWDLPFEVSLSEVSLA